VAPTPPPSSARLRNRFAGLLALVLIAGTASVPAPAAERIRGSTTYRAEVTATRGVVAAGHHFAGEAGMRMLVRGGNAVDAGVAATFAAAVSEISHFGLGGEVPIVLYLAERDQVVVINGQGTAPAAASASTFAARQAIPVAGPLAGTVPAVVDALAIALAEFGTRSLGEVLAPAIELADGFPWYAALTRYLQPELPKMALFPSGARVYLQGPGGTIPAVGSVFRQPDLARTLRALADEEQRHAARGRKAAIYAARDRFYRGDVGQRIAAAVQDAGGLLTAADLAAYRGRVEPPTRLGVTLGGHVYEVSKTGFWGQGPMLLQALQLLEGYDLARMGHNSTEYIHTVTEALKLALADRDAFYADPDVAKVPAAGLLSPAYAAERRKLIDPLRADAGQRAGDPWRFERRGGTNTPHPGPLPSGERERGRTASFRGSPDTTTVDVADAAGNLFSASPSSAWFFGGVFIAGDTGVPLGNRMQAFVLDENHPNVVQGGKRPRTTLSPTIVRRDGKPYVALSSPGGDSQDQQALQVLLNLAVFGMPPQEAIEAPRFNSLHHEESFGDHAFRPLALEVEDRIAPGVIEALRRLGHKVHVLGPFMMNTGTVLAGVDRERGTLFGAADPRRQRFVTGW
jgi:gamma-glutamyltranspeptidase/glutathione hydrolase